MIETLSSNIPLRFLCKYFSVSPSHYYVWKKGVLPQRLKVKETICKVIKKIFKTSNHTYGSPRMHQCLKEQGLKVSKNTVAKYMKEMDLDARLRKRYRVKTTDSYHSSSISPRLFEVEKESCFPTRAGQLLAGDITYLRVGEGFLYLAVVLDLYNREVVGWSMGKSLETKLVLEALDGAMKNIRSKTGIIFHSDRGSQYASETYRAFLEDQNIKPSMSRKGNCYDNAYVESWFSSLKKEWIYRMKYSTESELRSLVFEYIEVWYNKKRKHSSLGYLSPERYKKMKQIPY